MFVLNTNSKCVLLAVKLLLFTLFISRLIAQVIKKTTKKKAITIFQSTRWRLQTADSQKSKDIEFYDDLIKKKSNKYSQFRICNQSKFTFFLINDRNLSYQNRSRFTLCWRLVSAVNILTILLKCCVKAHLVYF